MTQFHPDIANIRLSPIVAMSEQVRKRAPEFHRETGKQFIPFQRGELDSRRRPISSTPPSGHSTVETIEEGIERIRKALT